MRRRLVATALACCATAAAHAAEALVARSAVYDGVAHLRVISVAEGLGAALRKQFEQAKITNTPVAIVLDLRFASGQSYEAAAQAADLFIGKAAPIFKAGNHTFRATSSDDEIPLPVALLVNGETQGAAEALAGALRSGASALIIGSETAGKARLTNDFALASGTTVTAGNGWIELPDGQSIGESGIKPDIEVKLPRELEQNYIQNPYWASVDRTDETGAAAASPRLINEAELMRRQRGEQLTGEGIDAGLPAPRVIADPALSRGIDFLKGVLLFHRQRS